MADRSSDQTVSGEQTEQLAQTLPGFDPSQTIVAAERGLLDFISRPVQEILNQLPLQRVSEQPAKGQSDSQAASDSAGAANQFDPFQLITSILGGLGTLGSGLLSGLDPTRVFRGVADAVDGSAIPLQQARSALAQDLQGAAGAATDAKTGAAVANGAEVATQADGLRDNLTTAAAHVVQARRQMVDIIDEFQAKIAAVDVTTSSGRAAAIAAANQAYKDSTAVMQQLRAALGAQAQKVSAIGKPVKVARPPDARNRATVSRKRRPDVDKIPVSKVQYKRRDYATGKAAYKKYIAQTLDLMGITDPKARRNWTNGLLTAASRESSFNPVAVNKWDSNAHGAARADGAPANSSRGGLQTIPTTFAAYHQAGTSTNIYDPVANAAAAMNYVMARYDVDRDGSNLTKLSQFDPNDTPRGY